MEILQYLQSLFVDFSYFNIVLQSGGILINEACSLKLFNLGQVTSIHSPVKFFHDSSCWYKAPELLCGAKYISILEKIIIQFTNYSLELQKNQISGQLDVF